MKDLPGERQLRFVVRRSEAPHKIVSYALDRNGSLKPVRTLACLPESDYVMVAPTLAHIYCGIEQPNDKVKAFIVSAATGRKRAVGQHGLPGNDQQWSPDGQFLLLQEEFKNDRHFVIHMKSATLHRVPLPSHEEVLYYFWRPTTSAAELVAGVSRRDSRSRIAPRLARIIFNETTGVPRLMPELEDGTNPVVLRRLLGVGTGSLVAAWRKEKHSSYRFGEDDVIRTPDGHCAFGVVRDIWRRSPTWATPDRALTLTALGPNVITTDAQALPGSVLGSTRFLQWATDRRTIFCITEDNLIWRDPLRGTEDWKDMPVLPPPSQHTLTQSLIDVRFMA